MNAAVHPNHHPLKARRVEFDLSNSPLHWIPNDPFASHAINGINLLLPAGEFWFCRVFNKALPYVTDPILRSDVQGFIRQEAIHARAHASAQEFLHAHGMNTEEVLQRVTWLFEEFLGDAPLGISALKLKALEKPWLILRVGIIATIEHFTGVLGQWSLDNTSWDLADPVVADLFRWHLAEEVEHRTVAFDLFEHLCQNQLGFYISRQALMAAVFPLFLYFLASTGRNLARQGSDDESLKIGRQSLLRLILRMETVGRKTENVPTLSFLTLATIRWISPKFNPIDEGDTQQALDYFAKSPAVQAIKTH
ncbi:metal-dependent hydrolase [Aquirhabdus sp.]|uniref:metal-dependent hydrolase n=1 Tax=Aquirhabdus sp. TaxID=2824160 RepID=UPI00396C596E